MTDPERQLSSLLQRPFHRNLVGLHEVQSTAPSLLRTRHVPAPNAGSPQFRWHTSAVEDVDPPAATGVVDDGGVTSTLVDTVDDVGNVLSVLVDPGFHQHSLTTHDASSSSEMHSGLPLVEPTARPQVMVAASHSHVSYDAPVHAEAEVSCRHSRSPQKPDGSYRHSPNASHADCDSPASHRELGGVVAAIGVVPVLRHWDPVPSHEHPVMPMHAPDDVSIQHCVSWQTPAINVQPLIVTHSGPEPKHRDGVPVGKTAVEIGTEPLGSSDSTSTSEQRNRLPSHEQFPKLNPRHAVSLVKSKHCVSMHDPNEKAH